MFKEIINFWFEEIEQKNWWIKDNDFDQLIITKYAKLHAQAIKGELYSWRKEAAGRLAEIIILDQFSRNMFRDTPLAFAYDSIALILAQESIAHNADKQLSALQRSFLYLPFMHSESPAMHKEAIRLYTKNNIASFLDYEKQHQDIIERFGRYPHRNKILGRESTNDEIEFLKSPNSSF